jgi:hypothetical protein
MKKQYTTAVTALAIGIATAIPVFAADSNDNSNQMGGIMGVLRSHIGFNEKNDNENNRGDMRNRMMRPIVTGTVTFVSGNIITISGKTTMHTASTTQATSTFTIDATNAKIRKDESKSGVSTIVVGDTLVVSGTLTGTNVVATIIHDGNKVMIGKHDKRDKGDGDGEDKNDDVKSPIFVGNGQPITMGVITAITGNTITISNKSNVTYTINATTSNVLVKNATSTVSALTVGDQLLVQGVVNGSSITASTIIDSGKVATTTEATGNNDNEKGGRGILQGLRGFFSRMFGF